MKQHKGKIICGLIIVLVIAGVWYRCAVNTIFPLDEEDIVWVWVSEENPMYQSKSYSPLPDEVMKAELIALFNGLTLQKDDVPFVRHSQELAQRKDAQNVLYHLYLDYDGIRAKVMRSFRVDLYICEDGRIIVWNGGYEYYDVVDGDFDALLAYLELCDKECFVGATLQDGTIIREK